MHAYYACMHIMHAYYVCMHVMHAFQECILCMHAYYECILCMHEKLSQNTLDRVGSGPDFVTRMSRPWGAQKSRPWASTSRKNKTCKPKITELTSNIAIHACTHSIHMPSCCELLSDVNRVRCKAHGPIHVSHTTHVYAHIIFDGCRVDESTDVGQQFARTHTWLF